MVYSVCIIYYFWGTICLKGVISVRIPKVKLTNTSSFTNKYSIRNVPFALSPFKEKSPSLSRPEVPFCPLSGDGVPIPSHRRGCAKTTVIVIGVVQTLGLNEPGNTVFVTTLVKKRSPSRHRAPRPIPAHTYVHTHVPLRHPYVSTHPSYGGY